MIKGVDVSHHQNDKGSVDWKKVKAAGYEFAFIKATQGTGYVDPFFKKNRDEARAAGLIVGFYHFAGNYNGQTSVPADPKAEADHFLKNVGELKKNDILVLDWEVSHADPSTWCRTFLDRVKEKTGVKALFYTYEAQLSKYGFKKVLEGDFGLWIAKYNKNDGKVGEEPNIAPWPFYAVWQYTSNGSVAGLPGSVDVNLSHMTADTLKKYGYQGNETPTIPAPTPGGARYFRYGHADQVFVKVGDRVKKGQKIGTVGKGGPNNFSAHVHFDIPKNKLAKWQDYVIGKSREYVLENYHDPEPYKYIVLPNFTHEGLNFLDFWQYSTGPAYHPGDDLNSGGGDSDLGDPFHSASEGVVIHLSGEDGSSNNGWGKLLVIDSLGKVDDNQNNEENSMDPAHEKNFKKILKGAGEAMNRDFGEYPNDSETEEILAFLKKKPETPAPAPTPEPPAEGKVFVDPLMREAIKFAHNIDIGTEFEAKTQRLFAEREVSLKNSEIEALNKVGKVREIVK